MDAETGRARAQLDEWRTVGADRLDPLRFAFMQALASRAARHQGRARQLIEARLSARLQDYAELVGAQPAQHGAEPGAGAVAGRGPLGGLLAQMAGPEPALPRTHYPELPALQTFRLLWSDMLAQRQLRQSMAQVPVDAGPLNSRVLVHRALGLMRDLSPQYLQHFLAYADHLAWLEHLHDHRLLAREASAQPAPRRKPATRKPRKRAD